MAGCTSVELERPDHDKVRFQIASYGATPLSTKATEDYKDGYANVPFGAFAWYKGDNPSDNADFMINQKITYDTARNIWAPDGTTYYWPKGGSLDFICYSPYSSSGIPSVSESKLIYTAWDVSANPETDLLYADKSAALRQNSSTYYYSGVPVLFRHALARASFSLKLAYSEITAPTGDKTKWEVTVNGITLKDVRTAGGLEIDLNGSAWDLPSSEIWTHDGTSKDIALDCSGLVKFTDTSPQTVGKPFFVLPQTLDQGQKLILNLTIKTWRDTGSGYGAAPLLIEDGVLVEAPITVTSLTKWAINQSTQYNLILTPSLADTATTPTEITFDPATAGWENITVNAEINI